MKRNSEVVWRRENKCVCVCVRASTMKDMCLSVCTCVRVWSRLHNGTSIPPNCSLVGSHRWFVLVHTLQKLLRISRGIIPTGACVDVRYCTAHKRTQTCTHTHTAITPTESACFQQIFNRRIYRDNITESAPQKHTASLILSLEKPACNRSATKTESEQPGHKDRKHADTRTCTQT